MAKSKNKKNVQTQKPFSLDFKTLRKTTQESDDQESLLKKFRRKKIIWGTVIAVIVVICIWSGTNSFPALENPKTVNYKWNYRDEQYSVKLTLYKSSYDYYASENCGSDSCFLKFNRKDTTLDQLNTALNSLGHQAGLSQDRIAELAVSFVQNIPYDKKKGKSAINGTQTEPNRHAYQVLYDKTGKCDEKSYLVDAILAKMGYGTALFRHEQDKHMTAGIKCLSQYSTYGSGYCIIETTLISRIGVAPLDTNSFGLASTANQIELYSSDPVNFGTPMKGEIENTKNGKVYQGIMEVVSTKQRLQTSSSSLAQLKKQIDSSESQLNNWNQQMNTYRWRGDYWNYNRLVPMYNNLLNTTNNQIDQYNQNVTTYNNLLKEYSW